MKILLATDGSECAREAAVFLHWFPFPANSELNLLSVIDKAVFKSKKEDRLSGEHRAALQRTKQMVREEGERLLEQEAATLRDAGWKVATRVRYGHPARQIVRAAKKLNADLVVVGSHGLTSIKRFLLGSVSDQVLEYAPCSVLIVKNPDAPGERQQPHPLRSLLAYDDSEPAREALRFFASLPLDESAEVTVLTVLPLVKIFRQDIKQRLSWVWKREKKAAREALERIGTEIKWRKPHVSTQLREGDDVSHELLQAATELHSDLLVLGHKGKGAIDKFLLGSVTSRIAHHSPCSVLAVRK